MRKAPLLAGLLLAAFGAKPALAACEITADQVAVFVDRNYQGTCRVLDAGFYATPAEFGLPNDSISSLSVGANVNLTLFVDSQSGVWRFDESSATFFGAGDGVWSVGSSFEDRTSAIQVASRFTDDGEITARVPNWFLGDNPARFRNQWAPNVQGIAHGDAHWYLSNRLRLYKDPLTAVLTGAPLAAVDMPGALSELGCDHFGDLDVAKSPSGEEFLFVPVEGCWQSPFGTSELVAVFDSELNLVTFDALFAAEQAGHASWLAFKPAESAPTQLFSSTFDVLGASAPLIRYELDWSSIFPDLAGHYFLYGGTERFFLQNESPTGSVAAEIANVQGGVFSPDGSVLYLSNGASLNPDLSCPRSRDGNGVHAFRTYDFTRIAQTSNGFGAFNLQNKPCSITSLEELEGIDFLDMNGRGGAFGGSLHVLMIANFNNSVYLKHYD